MSEDRRITKTKKSIKETLIELLKQTPLNKISVTELTRKADISRKTFYLHYSSVYDAKNDIDNDIITMLNGIIQTTPDSTRETDVMEFFSQLSSKTQSHEKLVEYFVHNSKQSNLYVKVKDALKEAILDRLQKNQRNKHNEYIIEFVVSGILNSYIEWSTKEDITLDELSVILTKLCTEASALLVEE